MGVNDGKVAPQIFDVQSVVTGTSTAYVFWTTNKFTTSDFYYSNSTPIASTTPMKISDSNLSFTHSVNIGGLTPNTTYYYMIKINDNRGNPATTTERSFTTLAN
jgi:phosphodiesterase/alkaline phosphatase D-like protein